MTLPAPWKKRSSWPAWKLPGWPPLPATPSPYHITVAQGVAGEAVGAATRSMGMNGFTREVPVFLVISETAYNRTASVGSKVKHQDYRSVDIGIAAAYLTAEAQTQGLSTCILGWFDSKNSASCWISRGTPPRHRSGLCPDRRSPAVQKAQKPGQPGRLEVTAFTSERGVLPMRIAIIGYSGAGENLRWPRPWEHNMTVRFCTWTPCIFCPAGTSGTTRTHWPS